MIKYNKMDFNRIFFILYNAFGGKYKIIEHRQKYGQNSEFTLQVRLLCIFIPPSTFVQALDKLLESEYYIQNEDRL